MKDLSLLKEELKDLIVTTLKLEEVKPRDIRDDQALFRDGLGLDSLDALELVVALEYKYGVVIPDEEVGKQVFRSINSLAEHVDQNRAQA